jgi:hypothetical protein
MLKKDKPVKFTRPMSTMRVVLLAVEHGFESQADIVDETKLLVGQVRSALWNLIFVGAVVRGKDATGRSIYVLPGRISCVSNCLKGVNSIFNARPFTRS